jgi:hypothetical protein
MSHSHSNYRLPTDLENAKTWLTRCAKRYFPDDADALLQLCLLGGSLSFPVGFSHPQLLLELVPEESVPESAFEDMSAGYVFLCSYYFLLDSVCDHHVADSSSASYLTQLCMLAQYFITESLSHFDNEVKDRCFFEFTRHVSENSLAVRSEIQLRSQLCCDELSSNECDIGRSNVPLLLYRLLALISNVPTLEQEMVVEILKKYVLVRQKLDDLGDWRGDFLTQNYTPFLRSMLSRLELPFSESACEREVYLSGAYERELSLCIKNLVELRKMIVEKIPLAVRFLEAVSNEQALATSQLQKWLVAKLGDSK